MMIGKLRRYKLVGGFDSPPLVPDPAGKWLKLDDLEEGIPLKMKPGEEISDAISRLLDEYNEKHEPKGMVKIDFNQTMMHMIGYTIQAALGKEETGYSEEFDTKAMALFDLIKDDAKRVPDEDHRGQFIAAMKRCLLILKGG